MGASAGRPVLAGTDQASPVGIICGGGSLPFALADSILARGRPVVLFPIRNAADPVRAAAYPHHWVTIGQFGRMCRLARAERCDDLVFIGSVVRPPINGLRLDWATIRLLPRIYRIYRGGDDHLLTGVARFFEEHGFRLLAPHELAPEILVPEGALGMFSPSEQEHTDIARGMALLAAIGPFDVGQAVVIGRNHVIAVEGAEGTDHMLARVAELRRIGRVALPNRVGVLVKAPKAGQDHRFDLPSIGPRTVEGVSAAGLAGIAVVAGQTVMAEPHATAAVADRKESS